MTAHTAGLAALSSSHPTRDGSTPMSTTLQTTSTSSPTSSPATPVPTERSLGRPTRGVPFHRLVRVEARKMVDTRAGRWLLIAIAALGALASAALAIWGPEGDIIYENFLAMAATPLILLFPVIGVMAATAEWSQRTGLVTFALEPRRGRVVGAKVVAATVLSLGVAVVVAAAAALVNLVVGGGWEMPHASVLGMVAALVILVLQGVAFGFAFLNTPLAVVLLLVAPNALTLLGGLSQTVAKVLPWVDLNGVTNLLIGGTSATGEQWAQAATSVGAWVLLPMAVGIWRVMTREVK